jgi:uncharacterized membrane protein YtjA (UPF0391 family)
VRPLKRFFSWTWRDIKSGENADLWILVVVSLIFTVLGVSGIASTAVLSSIVLSLLALLAISQIRNRLQVQSLAQSARADRTGLFLRDFPAEFHLARSRASHNYFFAGYTMARTLPTMRQDLERILSNKGTARILLPNPDNAALLQMIATVSGMRSSNPERIATHIRYSLDLAGDLAALGDLNVRTTDVLPRLGINALDVDQPDAQLMIQIYEFRPIGEAAPILILSRSDGRWFDHFQQQIERLWEAGTPWAPIQDARALESVPMEVSPRQAVQPRHTLPSKGDAAPNAAVAD